MSKAAKIIIATVIIVILGLLAWKLGPRFFKKKAVTPIDKEIEVLENSQATEVEVFYALTRLSSNRHPVAREEALKRAETGSQLVKEAAANALGHYDDPETTEQLKELLDSDLPPVRMRAIQGLGYVRNKEREDMLKTFLEKKEIRDDERLAALQTLARVTDNQATKEKVVDDLLDYSDKANNQDNRLALMLVTSLAPRSPRVAEQMKKKLADTTDQQFIQVSLGHLAGIKDPWVISNLDKLVFHKAPQIRKGAVRTFHQLCPADRWTLLNKLFATEKDLDVLKEISHEAARLRGLKSVEFFQQAVKDKRITQDLTLKPVYESDQKLALNGMAAACPEGSVNTSPAPTAKPAAAKSKKK